MALNITRETIIEELVDEHPKSVVFLMDHGIRCLRCGEPIWGTLGSAMDEKDFPVDRQLELVHRLREYLTSEASAASNNERK